MFTTTNIITKPLLFLLLIVLSGSPFIVNSLPTAENARASFYTITTYSNATKAPGTETYKLGLVGSYVGSNMTEKRSMMKFAVDYINNLTSLLPTVSLQLVGTEISGVKSNTILAALAAVADKAKVVVGGTGDTETEAVYAIAARYGLPQLAPVSNADAYSDQTSFPNMIRPIQATQINTPIVASIINYFGWSRCVILIGDDANGLDAYYNFILMPYGKTLNLTYAIVTVAAASSGDKAKMTEIAKWMNTTHVIVWDLPLATALRLIPQMNANGFVGPDFAYVLTDKLAKELQNYPDVFGAYDKFFSGCVVFSPKGFGNTTLYHQALRAWMASNPATYPGARPPSYNSWWAFEGIYMVAKAVDALVRSGTPANNITTTQLLSTIPTLNYEGVTGPVAFNTSGTLIDRLAYWDVFNYYNKTLIYKFSLNWQHTMVPYDIQPGNFTWFGGRTSIPEDYYKKIENLPTAPPPTDAPTAAPIVIEPNIHKYEAAISGGFGAIVGICSLVAIFAAVVLFTKKDEFKPLGLLFSTIVIAGSFVGYAGAFMLLPEKTQNFCMAFPWLVGIAFNIVFSCLFVEAVVLYRQYVKAQEIEKVVIPKLLLFGVMFIAVALEVILMAIWTVNDPLKPKLLKLSDSSYETLCHNDNGAFWAVFVGYKGIWVIATAVITYLTRHMHEENPHAKSIAYAIYNNLGLFVIGAPVAVGLSKVPQGTMIVEVVLVVLSFTFTMFILFFDVWFKLFFASRDIMTVNQMSKPATGGLRNNSNTNTNTTYNKNSYGVTSIGAGGGSGGKGGSGKAASTPPTHSPNSMEVEMTEKKSSGLSAVLSDV